MRHLSAEEILVLHAFIVDETGGLHGIRDIPLLQSIAHKPQSRFGGRELYRGIFVKVAILLEALANYHVFIDGNKRTSFTVAARFLFLNGYEIGATNTDVETTVLAVATKQMSVEKLTVWLKKNSTKISKKKK